MVFGSKIQEWVRAVFRSGNERQLETNIEKPTIKAGPKIKKGDLIRTRNHLLSIMVWQVPGINLKRASVWTKSKHLIPGFHRAALNRIGLNSKQPVLYLGFEVLPTTDTMYHPDDFTVYYFLHEGKVWFKTSSPGNLYEDFEIDEMFTPATSDYFSSDRTRT